MNLTGRKRAPLGTASPSSLRSNQRRRGGGSNNDDERCIPAPKINTNMNENIHPNLANSGLTQPSSLRDTNFNQKNPTAFAVNQFNLPASIIHSNIQPHITVEPANVFKASQNQSGLTQQTSSTIKYNST